MVTAVELVAPLAPVASVTSVAVPSFGLPAPTFAMWTTKESDEPSKARVVWVGLNYLLDVSLFQFLTQEKFEAAMARANESRVGHYTKKMLG